MKKIVALFIIMQLFLCVFVVDGQIPNDVKDTNLSKVIGLLNALDIVLIDSNGNFNLGEITKRKEMAYSACKLMGVNDSFDSQNSFGDLDEKEPLLQYINMANNLKLMNGYSSDTFAPNDSITIQQAVTILVKVLGYDEVAKSKGGYPAGYISIARETGILKGVEITIESLVDNGTLAKLIYNTLEADMIQQVKFSQGNFSGSITKGKNILGEVFGVKKLRGVVTENYLTALTGESKIAKSNIKIDNVQYEKAENAFDDYLGYEVDYYVNSYRGRDNIIFAYPTDNNIVLEVASDDLITPTRSQYNYYDEEGDLRSANITLNLDFIYNGKAYPRYVQEDMIPNVGKIKLIDNGDDGIYDVAFVEDYQNYVVENISLYNKTVTDKLGKQDLVLDKIGNNIEIKLLLDEQEADIKDIAIGDILTVYASKDNSYKKVIISNDEVSGRISTIDDNDKTIVSINGNDYIVSDTYSDADNRIALGVSGNFYFDAFGEIAYVDFNSSEEKYGYLLYIADVGGISRQPEIKVFDSDGKMQVIKLNRKISINGAPNVDASKIFNEAELYEQGNSDKKKEYTKSQLIRYRLSQEGLLTDIKTALDKTSIENYIGYSENEFSLDAKYSSVKYFAGQKNFGTLYGVNNKTIFFIIPSDISKEVDFNVISDIALGDYLDYNIELYDNTPSFTIEAAIIKPPIIEYWKYSDSVFVVEKVSSIVNADGDVAISIAGYKDGVFTKLETKDINVKSSDIAKDWGHKNYLASDLKCGDVIQYTLNKLGKVDKIKVIFNLEEDGKVENLYTEKMDSGIPSALYLYSHLATSYGKVQQRSSYSNVIVKTNPNYNRNFLLANAKIILLYKKTNKLTLGTVKDIDPGDNIFITTYVSISRNALVIKEEK